MNLNYKMKPEVELLTLEKVRLLLSLPFSLCSASSSNQLQARRDIIISETVKDSPASCLLPANLLVHFQGSHRENTKCPTGVCRVSWSLEWNILMAEHIPSCASNWHQYAGYSLFAYFSPPKLLGINLVLWLLIKKDCRHLVSVLKITKHIRALLLWLSQVGNWNNSCFRKGWCLFVNVTTLIWFFFNNVLWLMTRHIF